MQTHRLQNYLLRTMADADFARLEPALTLVELGKNEELAQPETRVRHTWFPLSGVVSIIASTESGLEAEVGIVGREG